jgi:hypothetical protein
MKKILLTFYILFFTLVSFSQTLTSVNPSSAQQGQNLNVSISGSNLHFTQATNTIVWFNQGSSTIAYPLGINILNDNSLNAYFNFAINQNTGWYNVNISNNIDGTVTLPNYFAITANSNAPNLISIAPNNGNQGQMLSVSISGANTHFAQATNTTIWFEQGSSTVMMPYSFQSQSNTLINANLLIGNQQQTGSYNLYLMNEIDGYLNLQNSFTVNSNPNQAQLVSVNPNSATQGDILSVSITGQNTHFNQGTSTITWFQQGSSTIIYPTNQNSTSATNLSANYFIPNNANLGLYDTYTYNNSDGLLVLPNSFIIQTPVSYQITALANPSNSGYITGSGVYTNNQICNLYAYNNPGYYFVNWTENGNIVSTTEAYSFMVNSNRNLIANFSPINQFYITTMVNPAFSGIVNGFGAYNMNQTAALHAIANQGWKFVNWTENGISVSIDTVYSFTVTTNRTLVANFNVLISVPEFEKEGEIRIYPIPTENNINIDFNGFVQKEIDLKLFDVLGKLVYYQNFENTSKIEIDCINMPKGVYYLKIKQNDKKIITKKVIINN